MCAGPWVGRFGHGTSGDRAFCVSSTRALWPTAPGRVHAVEDGVLSDIRLAAPCYAGGGLSLAFGWHFYIRAVLGDGWHLAAGARLDNTSFFMKWWRVFCCGVLLICCQDLGLLRSHSSAVMDAPDNGSPVRTYVHNYYSMRKLHNTDSSEPQGLSSLGVLDLDLSITPDVFGVHTFDEAKPLTHMLTGQFPN